MEKPTIGAILREARKHRGLSQDALAEKSGVSQSQIARIEKGTTANPGFIDMLQLARALAVAVTDLIPENFDEQMIALSKGLVEMQQYDGVGLEGARQLDRLAALERRLETLERTSLSSAETARDALALAQQHEAELSRRRKRQAAS